MGRAFSRIVTCAVICLIAWLAGLIWFIEQIPSQPSPGQTQADAIVILTGGGGRLEHALRLLADGKGKTVFISGVGEDTTVKDILRQVSPALRQQLEPMAASIFLGHQARNTIGNAEETLRWIQENHYRTIRLVTANYHLPRSINEFEELMPDIVIVPEPVFPDNFNSEDWWYDASSRALLLSEYHKYIAGELRHWFVSVNKFPSPVRGESQGGGKYGE